MYTNVSLILLNCALKNVGVQIHTTTQHLWDCEVKGAWTLWPRSPASSRILRPSTWGPCEDVPSSDVCDVMGALVGMADNTSKSAGYSTCSRKKQQRRCMWRTLVLSVKMHRCQQQNEFHTRHHVCSLGAHPQKKSQCHRRRKPGRLQGNGLCPRTDGRTEGSGRREDGERRGKLFRVMMGHTLRHD